MRVVQISFVVGLLAVAAACSSSSSPPANNNPGPSDAAIVLPTGDGSMQSLNPPTTTPPPGPVMCGSMTCNPPMVAIPGITLTACCRSDNSCGGAFMLPGGMAGGSGAAGCLSTSAGTPAPACGGMMMMGIPLMGCCTTSGLCGIDLTMAGLGCNTAQDLSALGGMFGMGGAMDAGPPETCAAAAAAAEAGAGAEAGPTGADGH